MFAFLKKLFKDKRASVVAAIGGAIVAGIFAIITTIIVVIPQFFQIRNDKIKQTNDAVLRETSIELTRVAFLTSVITDTPVPTTTITPSPTITSSPSPTVTPEYSEIYPLLLDHNNIFMRAPTLITKIDGQDYGTLPTGCVILDFDGSDWVLDEEVIKNEFQEHSFAFNLVTDQTMVITDIVIQVDYSPPPDEKVVEKILVVAPPGIGAPIVIHFPQAIVDSSSESIIISHEDGSIRLDPGDAVTLVIPLDFRDPGLYNLVFTVRGQLALSRNVAFRSDVHSYGWMNISNITDIDVDLIYNEDPTYRELMPEVVVEWKGMCP